MVMNISDDFDYETILTGLDRPHGVHFDGESLFVLRQENCQDIQWARIGL